MLMNCDEMLLIIYPIVLNNGGVVVFYIPLFHSIGD